MLCNPNISRVYYLARVISMRSSQAVHLMALLLSDNQPKEDKMSDLIRLGDYVIKNKGYEFLGVVVSIFNTTEGKLRYVVESRLSVGMLHIFNREQLDKEYNNDDI